MIPKITPKTTPTANMIQYQIGQVLHGSPHTLHPHEQYVEMPVVGQMQLLPITNKIN